MLFSLSEEKEVEKEDVAISISLYTHHEPSIPWCRLSAGRKKKFHAYLIKEAKAIIKTTAQLVIFDWLSSGCNEYFVPEKTSTERSKHISLLLQVEEPLEGTGDVLYPSKSPATYTI